MVSMADSLNEISFHNLQIDLFIHVNVYHRIMHERLSPINNSDWFWKWTKERKRRQPKQCALPPFKLLPEYILYIWLMVF